jgi:hypothetical protein
MEWIGLAAGICFGIMGLGAYLKNNLESRQREREYQKTIEELKDIIRKGQLVKFEEVVPVQKRMVQEAKSSVWIFSINSLGIFHEHREDLLSLVKRGGSLKVLLLDPESEAFREREEKEESIEDRISGRLKAEYEAAVAYCTDISNFVKGGDIELRLHRERIKEALLIIDADTESSALHINTYPADEHTRGYIGEHRIIPKESPDLIKPYVQRYKTVWNGAKKIELS